MHRVLRGSLQILTALVNAFLLFSCWFFQHKRKTKSTDGEAQSKDKSSDAGQTVQTCCNVCDVHWDSREGSKKLHNSGKKHMKIVNRLLNMLGPNGKTLTGRDCDIKKLFALAVKENPKSKNVFNSSCDGDPGAAKPGPERFLTMLCDELALQRHHQTAQSGSEAQQDDNELKETAPKETAPFDLASKKWFVGVTTLRLAAKMVESESS